MANSGSSANPLINSTRESAKAHTDTQTAEVIETIQTASERITSVLPGFRDWVPDSMLPVWDLIAQFPIVGALLIAAFSYCLAVLVRYTLFRSVKRLTRLTSATLDDQILEYLKRPVFSTVVFFGWALAVNAAQLPFGTTILFNILLSIIVTSWMRAALNISTVFLDALANEALFTLIKKRTVPLIDLTSKLLILLVGSYVLLLVWGVNPLGWLASAGIVGIAVGFAAKDTLANLFAGFFIVADAPYKLGDYINLDTGERGRVTAIGLRSTRLLTRDDVEITIPNGVIANAKIVNESGGPSAKLRIRIIIGVAYGSDVNQVTELLAEIGNSHPEVCATPAPRVRLRGFGASSLDFNLMCWIQKPQDRGRISHEIHMSLYNCFAANGIEIPFAQQDIHIKQWPSNPEN
ncbi:MAG: mechanosensitive ion channel family protein [Pseudomonadales bacterium]|nr:mechanosensitive ion channel family protein [Pseudomonadales bacterium]